MSLSTLVKNGRVLLGLSARRLAAKIEVSHSYVSQIESGTIRKPSLAVLKNLAAVLPNTNYWELLSASGYQTTPEPTSLETGVDDTSGESIIGGRQRTELREVIFRKLYEAAESIAKAPGAVRVESRSTDAFRKVPLFTTIPASFGQPSGATIADYDEFETIHIHESQLNYDSSCFALRVKGDSMVEAGILPGDVVVVSPNTPYESGDICVVRTNGSEHSLKRLVVRGDLIILQPANSRYEPEVIDNSKENDLFIYGKVIHVERSLI